MDTQALRAIAVDPDVVERDYAPTIISAADEIDRLLAERTITLSETWATQAAKIESDAKVIAALREKLKLMDDYYQTGGDLMSHMAHMAQDALAIIEQIASECPDCGGMGFTDQPCPKCGGDF